MRGKWSHVSLVWRCWVLGFGGRVVLCSYVPWGGSRFTYCMLTNSGEEDICCSSPTTLHSIHFIPYSYPFPLLGKQLSTSGSIPGFIKLKRPLVRWLAVWLAFPSFLFLFGIIRLAPTGRPWGCHRAHFSWGRWLLLAAFCQTCITWKVLHRFFKISRKKNCTQKRDSLTGMHVVRKSEGGKDEEVRRKSKREKLNSMWEETHKTKNGPECAWRCCQQCLVFISCLVLTPMWLATAWFRGVSHLLDQLERRQRVLESVLLECFVFVSTSVSSNAAQNSTGRAEAFTTG